MKGTSLIPPDFQKPTVKGRSVREDQTSIESTLVALRENCENGLNIGAGSTRMPGLKSCDLYNPDADLRVAATDLTSIPDASVDLIESHHMIEHLPISDCEIALGEWHRVLIDQGLLIITCPDIKQICKDWLDWTDREGEESEERIDYMVKMLVGSQEHAGMFHKNAFDEKRLKRAIRNSGFEVLFSYSPYPDRSTPSLLMIASKQ